MKSKINFKTNKTGKVIKLNNPYINRAILEIYNTYNPTEIIELKDIKYIDNPRSDDRYKLLIKGKPIMYFDRHRHYPDQRNDLCGVFEYLLCIQTYFDNLRIMRRNGEAV